MGLYEADPVSELSVGFAVKDDIGDSLVCVKVHLGIGWESEPAILHFDLLDGIRTQFLWEFSYVKIFR